MMNSCSVKFLLLLLSISMSANRASLDVFIKREVHGYTNTTYPTPKPIAPSYPAQPPYANNYVKVKRPKRYPKPTPTPIAPKNPTQPPYAPPRYPIQPSYANNYVKVKRPKDYKAKSAKKKAKNYSPQAVWHYPTPSPEPVVIVHVYPPSYPPSAKSKSTKKSKSYDPKLASVNSKGSTIVLKPVYWMVAPCSMFWWLWC